MNDKEIENIPRHIAIIMDGNGRWAQAKKRPRIMGHQQGAKVVEKISRECAHLGVEQLTLYTFSEENWQRPVDEVQYLMNLLKRFLRKERKNLVENNIRFCAIGDLERLPKDVQHELQKSIDVSYNNDGMKLCLALSYGSRSEIVDATKKIAAQVAKGEINIEDINHQLFAQNLYQPNMQDPDLLIRTGGDMRVSNFLLWQISYSELWVTHTMWPDFAKEDLLQAIQSYSTRERRFGKISAQVKENHRKIIPG
ncbi:isoprenyl transferase [Candidatus Uabimicrobium amorphum]|uniref:Isoprenyl transferase n=1 Tax=Uabimicrobium amorphum TaxID=2596890 RepID=A0A5S9IT11_UABAM|nr:isoprenyl transferase [Candidatus Uabimicrobium amorphum]BBM87613.1 isoprenyl transferase [Candidatus Uabimicrobium amorphum]